MQWIHSLKGLVSHLAKWSEFKIAEVDGQIEQVEKDKKEREQVLQRQVLESRFNESRKVNFHRPSGLNYSTAGSESGMRKIGGKVIKMLGVRSDDEDGKEMDDELASSDSRDMLMLASPERSGTRTTPVKRLETPRSTYGLSVTAQNNSTEDEIDPTETFRARATASRWKRRHTKVMLLPPVASPEELPPKTPSSAPRRLSTVLNFGNIDALSLSRPRPGSHRLPTSRRSFSYTLKSMRNFGNMVMGISPARKSFQQEVGRSHRCVLNPGGTLQVRPLQALNIGEKSKPLYLAVRYGLQMHRTAKAKASVYPRWDKNVNQNEVVLDIEPLETTGNVQISIWSEHELHDVELARLEVPLGCVLDCCGDDVGEYTKWFPLVRPRPLPEDGGDDGRGLYPATSEKDRSEAFVSEPCVKLVFQWKSKEKLPGSRTISYLRAYLREFSVSLIDSYQPMELISLSIRNVEARYVDSIFLTRANVVVSWLQVDNQMPSTDVPVILGPTPVQLPQPLVQLSLFRNKQKNHQQRSSDNLISLQYVFVLLQELDLKLEERLMLALWRFTSRILLNALQEEEEQVEADGAGSNEEAVHYEAVDELFAGVNSPREKGRQTGVREQCRSFDAKTEEDTYGLSTKMVYIEQLELCPIKVNLCFFKGASDKRAWRSLVGAGGSTLLLQQDTDKEGIMLTNSAAVRKNPGIAAAYSAFQLVTDMILPLIPSFSDASIKLNALNITHVFQTPEQITATLQAHYTSNFLFQLYRIIGSVDLIGNPMSFVSSLGTGVIDFFYEPAQGLVKVCKYHNRCNLSRFVLMMDIYPVKQSPKAFVRGVVKGTSSLVTNTTSGFLSVAGRISNSVGRGFLFTISKDSLFMQGREKLAKEKNNIYLLPLRDVVHGLAHGVTGVIVDPYYGAKKSMFMIRMTKLSSLA